MHDPMHHQFPKASNAGGASTRALLFGCEGPASDADAFAAILKLVSAEVHNLKIAYMRKGSLARLAALSRLDCRVVEFLPKDVASQIGPRGPLRPHAVNPKARVREAVVHAALLLEAQGSRSRTDGAINRNLWKIANLAADFLTDHYRTRGGRENILVSPAPVSARTIRRWLQNYEDDLICGLHDKPRRRLQSDNRDLAGFSDVLNRFSFEQTDETYDLPSNVVPLIPKGEGHGAKFVPWWMRGPL